MAVIFDIPMIKDCRSCPIKNYIFEDDNGIDRYACPSNLLDKEEALNNIMLAYNDLRNTQNRMAKEG